MPSLSFFLHRNRQQDWEEAIRWYDSALNMDEHDEGGEFDGIQDDPRYLLLAREAEMFTVGGYNLAADPQKAGRREAMTIQSCMGHLC